MASNLEELQLWRPHTIVTDFHLRVTITQKPWVLTGALESLQRHLEAHQRVVLCVKNVCLRARDGKSESWRFTLEY
jgi:hypothetical protein